MEWQFVVTQTLELVSDFTVEADTEDEAWAEVNDFCQDYEDNPMFIDPYAANVLGCYSVLLGKCE